MDLENLLQVVVAALLAGVLGWERESLGKPAGLRTHLLVAVGATLAMAVGDSIIARFNDGLSDWLRMDPLRVMEAVLTGIGFLCAGTIISRRDREQVSGLTTAASLWATAVVGLAVGAGRYVLAAGATAIIFGILRGLGYLEHRHDLAGRRDPGRGD